MLNTLQIENYALIEQLTIEFGPGFNALTGETGSGKSIIVDALGLLLGERAEAGVIRTGAQQATVSGLFNWGDGEILLRRDIGLSRSRAFVDGQLSTLAALRERARELGQIHSQNEALVAFTPAAQLAMLDRFAGVATEAVAQAHEAWQAAREALRALQSQQQQRLQQLDLWKLQLDEIDGVKPLAGEDAALEQERQILAHAEKITAAADAAYSALYEGDQAATTQLKAALRQLQEWERWDAAVADLAQRIDAVRLEADDIAGEIRQRADRVEASPRRLAEVEERLAAIERLRRKYGPTLEQVLAHRERLTDELAAAEALTVETAQAAADAAAANYHKLAEGVSAKRKAAAAKLAKAVETEVADLAMKLKFEVAFDPAGEWRASGWDQIRFLAAINPGEPAKPVTEIASGGELSRLLLGLHLVIETKAIAPREGAIPTVVLDEVDAGIGGRAAEVVGRKLQQLGRHFQVLCVTHLAQIATFAGTHLQVEKAAERGRTKTRVTRLEDGTRAAEIARMLAGRADDPTALRHAEELLAANRRRDARSRD